MLHKTLEEGCSFPGIHDAIVQPETTQVIGNMK